MGILQVQFSHTLPISANTLPVHGVYRYRPVNIMVSYKTHGINVTHGILMIYIF